MTNKSPDKEFQKRSVELTRLMGSHPDKVSKGNFGLTHQWHIMSDLMVCLTAMGNSIELIIQDRSRPDVWFRAGDQWEWVKERYPQIDKDSVRSSFNPEIGKSRLQLKNTLNQLT